MTDRSLLLRLGDEHGVAHQRLGEFVDYLTANMEPDKAAEALDMLRAAFSPGYHGERVRRAEDAERAEAERQAQAAAEKAKKRGKGNEDPDENPADAE